ncbi:MAG: hypothetical protein HXO65_00185 [Rothia mucilaginosa]|uniref:Uncharacterized protein n=1 Tax=Rothia mucilaginosa TaxID=43675 RepID=A0A930PYT5_9MICC|nr:hypothetical protein [Rothia mucilaginosa]
MSALNSEASAAAMKDAGNVIIHEMQSIAAALENLTQRVEALENGAPKAAPKEVSLSQLADTARKLQELDPVGARAILIEVANAAGYQKLSEAPASERPGLLRTLEEKVAELERVANA